MKNLFLFTDKQKTQDSDFFTVFPGHVAVLTAHGVPLGTHPSVIPGKYKEPYKIYVERASVPPDDLNIIGVRSSLDGLSILPKLSPRYVSRVANCCEWALTACDNLKVITVPGVYRLVMSDPSMLGTTIVEAVTMTTDQAALLPSSIKFGN